jgi:hypothetical protein
LETLLRARHRAVARPVCTGGCPVMRTASSAGTVRPPRAPVQIALEAIRWDVGPRGPITITPRWKSPTVNQQTSVPGREDVRHVWASFDSSPPASGSWMPGTVTGLTGSAHERNAACY